VLFGLRRRSKVEATDCTVSPTLAVTSWTDSFTSATISVAASVTRSTARVTGFTVSAT